MLADSDSLHFGQWVASWPIPGELSDFESYGLWNGLTAYDQAGELIEIVPAHDGDFFPLNPLIYMECLRGAVLSKKGYDSSFWPIQVDIDITQRCTNNCYFCYSRQYALDPLYRDAEISVDTFQEILEELAEQGTSSIRFTGGGEPLAHSAAKRIIPKPRRYGLRSCIITNGDLLDEEISELLVCNVDHIRISINAAQNSTRHYVHRPTGQVNNLSKIFQQVKFMAQLRDAIWPSQKRPLICATFLILPENVSEIYHAAQTVRDCGIDSISFRPVYHDLSHQFSRHDLEILQRQLKLASSLHGPPTFQVFTPKRDIAVAGHISPGVHFARCISCCLRTIIEATNLGPMIKVCGLHRGTRGESLGVVRGGIHFSELWRSNYAHKTRSNHPETCERCIDVSMNVTLNKMWGVLVKHPEAEFRKSWHRRLPGKEDVRTSYGRAIRPLENTVDCGTMGDEQEKTGWPSWEDGRL